MPKRERSHEAQNWNELPHKRWDREITRRTSSRPASEARSDLRLRQIGLTLRGHPEQDSEFVDEQLRRIIFELRTCRDVYLHELGANQNELREIIHERAVVPRAIRLLRRALKEFLELSGGSDAMQQLLDADSPMMSGREGLGDQFLPPETRLDGLLAKIIPDSYFLEIDPSPLLTVLRRYAKLALLPLEDRLKIYNAYTRWTSQTSRLCEQVAIEVASLGQESGSSPPATDDTQKRSPKPQVHGIGGQKKTKPLNPRKKAIRQLKRRFPGATQALICIEMDKLAERNPELRVEEQWPDQGFSTVKRSWRNELLNSKTRSRVASLISRA